MARNYDIPGPAILIVKTKEAYLRFLAKEHVPYNAKNAAKQAKRRLRKQGHWVR